MRQPEEITIPSWVLIKSRNSANLPFWKKWKMTISPRSGAYSENRSGFSSFKKVNVKIIIAIVVTLFLTGCVGGQAFLRPQSDTINLGKTTYDEVVKSKGEPRRTGTLVRNNATVKTITYSHAVAVPFSTKLSTRVLIYSFYEGVLVGYDYASSFDEDRNEKQPNEEAIMQLKTGDNRSRVIALLGKPDGEFIFPLVEKNGSTAVRYSFIKSSRVPFIPTLKITTKVTTIVFDEKGAVTAIASAESKPD